MSIQQPLPTPCKSEVALLLEQIDLEYTAAYQGLHGLASGSSQHEVITSKMERMSDAFEKLKGEVGEEQALKLTIEIMEHCDEPKAERRAEGSIVREETPS